MALHAHKGEVHPSLNFTDWIRKAKKTIGAIDNTYVKGFTSEGIDYKGIDLNNLLAMWCHFGQVLYVTKLKEVSEVDIQST